MFKHLTRSLVNIPRFYHIISKRNVQVAIKDELLSLTFPFIMGSKMLFIHSQYTFLTIQEQLELEESTKVEIDFQGTNLGLNSNLYKYLLNDQSNKPVKMIIQDEEFTLIPAYQTNESKILKISGQLKHSPMQKYQNMVNLGIDPSHANTLSWFLNSVNITQNSTPTEITRAMETGLQILKQPTKDKLYELQHVVNILEAEICKGREQLDKMVTESEKIGYRWLSMLFILSLIQIGAFYYGIYMVDEWGWNVCEPVTYTLQCVTVLLGMIFYVRYRRQREMETIRWAFMFRKQIKERNWKDRWNHLNTLIQLKEEEKRQLELRKVILHNRMNYHYYVQQSKYWK